MRSKLGKYQRISMKHVLLVSRCIQHVFCGFRGYFSFSVRVVTFRSVVLMDANLNQIVLFNFKSWKAIFIELMKSHRNSSRIFLCFIVMGNHSVFLNSEDAVTEWSQAKWWLFSDTNNIVVYVNIDVCKCCISLYFFAENMDYIIWKAKKCTQTRRRIYEKVF